MSNSKQHKRLVLWLDRALSRSLLRQIAILLITLIVLYGLSLLLISLSVNDDLNEFCKNKNTTPFLLPLYLLIDSNALNNLYFDAHGRGWMLTASIIIYVLGVIVFNGAIIGVIVSTMNRRIDDHRKGLIHYLKSGHYIIMGYDEMVPSIMDHIFSKDHDAYVLLLSSVDKQTLHSYLEKSIVSKHLDHIIINHGHRTTSDTYPDIYLHQAREIFIVGKRSLPAHDATNIECIDSICSYLQDYADTTLPQRITCVFDNIDTYAAFKTSEIFNQIHKLGIEFMPYNVYSSWAQQIFYLRQYKWHKTSGGLNRYPSIYGDGIGPDSKKQVHLVFVGTTSFAVSLAIEAAHILHFPNFYTHGIRTRITFIELNADHEKDEFATRNRHFFEVQDMAYRDLSPDSSMHPTSTPKQIFGKEGNFLDIDFEFIRGDILSAPVQELIAEWAKDDSQHLSIFLAMSNQRMNFVMGMNMPDAVYDNAIPIFIRQQRSDNFVANLQKTDDEQINTYAYIDDEGNLQTEERKHRYANIYPFGMDNTAFFIDEKAMIRAKLINYLYSTCDEKGFKDIAILNTMLPAELLKAAEERWNEIPVAHRWSNYYCAYSIPCKLATLRQMRHLAPDDMSHDNAPLTDNEKETLAIMEHNRWNVEKLLMGYRKARPKEDKYEHDEQHSKKLKNNKKLFIHHDIRPFDKLGKDAKLYDYEISRYIPWIITKSDEIAEATSE